jgi:hypothetical protein
MRWSELGAMQFLGQIDLAGGPVELFRATDGTLYQVRRARGVYREVRPGERLGDFERWDLLMPDPFGLSAGT